MTHDEMAEFYDLARSSVQYRLKHGIPMDAPKHAGRKKGVAPVKRCGCPIKAKCDHGATP